MNGGERGEYLFHYTTREAAFEYIIPERRLRLSSYELMGDPLEASPWGFGGSYVTHEGDDDAPWDRTFWESFRQANIMKARMKVLALSEDAPEGYEGDRDAFGRGWARARMWERYGERHKGVCLAFRREVLTERVISALGEQGARQVRHDRVRDEEEGLEGHTAPITLNLNVVKEAEIADALEAHFEQHGDGSSF